ncbi:MAG: molybdopterin-dependent oxidoreductase, partial [Spirochaetales bacterium]|nr:molybdopterin-dependent oxidoreductase [Candidatus Physcosoma equi]
CEMVAESVSMRSGVIIRLTTWSDNEDKPKHEEVSVVVNQGVYAIAGKEVQRQLLTGLLPKYKLDSYRAVIRTEKTMTAPSVFCGFQLFASAVTALSLHTSRMAAKANLTPAKFITDFMSPETRFTDMAPVHELATLSSKIRRVTDKSDYTRKWASSNLHTGEFGLAGYLSGIGLSYGLGIAGFSTTTARENEFKAQVAYTLKKNVAVSGTVPAYMAYDKTTKDTLSRFFYKGDTNETVLFTEIDQETPDSGPDVLSSYTSIFLPQLMTATVRLGQLIDQQDPPVNLKFSAQNLSSPCEFEYSGFGAAVCEISISKTSLQPVAKRVWIDVALSTIYGKTSKQRVKSLVLQTLTQLGAELAPDFSLEMNLSSEGKDVTTFSSIESTVTSLTMGAYTNAIWQATGEHMSVSLPAKAKAIEKILNGGKGEN